MDQWVFKCLLLSFISFYLECLTCFTQKRCKLKSKKVEAIETKLQKNRFFIVFVCFELELVVL